MPDPPGFAAFWSAYPKKRGKLDALKAWKQTTKARPSMLRLLDAIRHQKGSEDWLRQDGRYIPHPATWLRRGCWDDEVNPPDGPPDGTLKPIKWRD